MPTDVRFGSKADICSAKWHVRFTPESGHLRGRIGMSAIVPKRHSHRSKQRSLFDHLVGAGEQGRRNVEAVCPGRLQVDHKLEFG